MAEFPFVFAQGEGPLLPPSAGHSPWYMPRGMGAAAHGR